LAAIFCNACGVQPCAVGYECRRLIGLHWSAAKCAFTIAFYAEERDTLGRRRNIRARCLAEKTPGCERRAPRIGRSAHYEGISDGVHNKTASLQAAA
jgi:hypothetical protein